MSNKPAETISDVIGVAGAGFRLSLILNAVSCEVASGGLEVHSISKSVTLFSLTLKQVGISLQSPDSVHTQEALDGIHQVSHDATDVFDEFNDMLDRIRAKPADGATAPSIEQRFQWCFKRHRVLYLLGQLECLKMTASLIQQILSLGKLMASTNKHDSQQEVTMKQELIRQERAEAQNVLIVRYWQMSKMDRLWEASRTEDEDHKIATSEQHDDDLALVASNDDLGGRQLAIEAPPPEYAKSMALVKLPPYSLGEIEQRLDGIKKSSKDMVQVSSEAIDPLLEKWTRWYEVREKRHSREARSRYVPTVDNLQEDEDDGMRSNQRRYEPTNDSGYQARGYFLEGSTTNWREPHSADARQKYSQRRKEYRKYQPSISVDTSDAETNSNGSRKRAPRHHIIDSSPESSESDHEHQHQPRQRPRRGSNSPVQERSYPAFHNTASPRNAPGLPATGRPYPQHAYTAPNMSGYPPINTSNAHNSYTNAPHTYPTPPHNHAHSSPNAAYAPHHQQTYPPISSAHARYTPANVPPQPTRNLPPPNSQYSAPPSTRPLSRDGTTRSPSRTSYHAPSLSAPSSRHASFAGAVPSARPRLDDRGRPIHWDAHGRAAVYDKEGREVPAVLGGGGAQGAKAGGSAKKNVIEGTTKGLLGAGAIAGFLEALEGLSI